MNATLKFKLPEEQQDFQVALEGGEWRCVAVAMSEKFRQIDKQGIARDEGTDAALALLDDLRTFFYDTLDEYNLDL